jgi:hypothetical protein
VGFSATEFLETIVNELRSEQRNFNVCAGDIIWNVRFCATEFVENTADELGSEQ